MMKKQILTGVLLGASSLTFAQNDPEALLNGKVQAVKEAAKKTEVVKNAAKKAEAAKETVKEATAKATTAKETVKETTKKAEAVKETVKETTQKAQTTTVTAPITATAAEVVQPSRMDALKEAQQNYQALIREHSREESRANRLQAKLTRAEKKLADAQFNVNKLRAELMMTRDIQKSHANELQRAGERLNKAWQAAYGDPVYRVAAKQSSL